MVPIFKNGKQVYEPPSLQDVRQHATKELESLENETKRFTNPHLYKVSLSDRLHHVKKNLLLWHQETASNGRT
jgi:nicotinate phosphoribosyltransferase